MDRAARGETSEPTQEETATLPVIRNARLPASSCVLLPFPAGFPETFKDDPKAGIAARRRFGRLAAGLFAEGFEAVSVVERPSGPAYVLERS